MPLSELTAWIVRVYRRLSRLIHLVLRKLGIGMTDQQTEMDRLRGIVLHDLRSADEGARADFHREFAGEISTFAEATASALDRWHQFMEPIPEEASRQISVAAITFTAINHSVMSFKLFMTGYTVASGALFRQVLEGTCLALVCSAKSLTVLDRYLENHYSPNKAVDYLAKHAKKVGFDPEALKAVVEAYESYHRFAHLSRLTIAAGLNYSVGGVPNVGAYFDPAKLPEYRHQVRTQVSFARALPNVIGAVARNVAAW